MTDAADRPTRLGLTGVSTDGRRLLLVDDQGAGFSLEITPDLRTAVRGDVPRRLETKMSSSIRPREIQDRIRAGETAEAVAEAAGTTLEAIMPYVAPVLAEREHVAARAQKASLRRGPGEGAPAHTQTRALGDAVSAHLRGLGADPGDVTWDSYRRETGRWVLTGSFSTGERSGTARFTYDAPGSYALCDNDDARWLVGDRTPEAAAPTRDDLQQARERRLSAVPAEELPFADDALDLVSAATPADAMVDEVLVDVPAAAYDEPVRATADQARVPEPTAAEVEAEQARQRRPVQKKRGRASVPSWDEIMFGGGDQ